MKENDPLIRRFEAAYSAHGTSVYRLAMVYLGRPADAEDVTQEVFLKLLYKAPAFADGEHEKRWLLRVTANLCRDQLKTFWRRQTVALDESCPVRSGPDRAVLETILALPETYKGPIHLHYYEGYSVAEVADDGTLLARHYWAAEGDQLVPLETHTTKFSTTWEGVTYTDTVYWCEYEGAISCHCDGTAGYALDYDCNTIAIPGSTDSVILRLSQGSQMDYRQYPVLLDLETGEVTDLLGGTGWEKAAPLTDVRWTDDLSAAILSSDRTGWFYCDRTAQTTTALDELTGLEVFSAWFGQDGALILLTRSGPDGECYDVWTWQPENGQLKRTFSQLPVYQSREETPHGFQFFFGGGRGIYVAQDGTVSVLDLVTGGTTIVEDFLLSQQENATLIANASGTKVLFASYDGHADGLGISSLGVMDLEKGVFTLLDRENYDALQEGSLSWFDEDRVAITAHGKEDYNETYLYLYRF